MTDVYIPSAESPTELTADRPATTPGRTTPMSNDTAPTPLAIPTNWGRWGEDDDRGTLNHLSEESAARGARTVRSGRAVSLAMPITPVPLAGGGPAAGGMTMMPAPVLQMISYDELTSAHVDLLVINTHNIALTHIDAPVHCPVENQVYPGVHTSKAVSGGRAHHGTTSALAPGISTRGVLLDLAPGTRLDPGYDVTGKDFDDAEKRAGLTIERGDALVVRGGWTVHRDLAEPLPGMTLDAVQWMADREISLYAGDIGDRPPGYPDDLIPLHYVALSRLGMPIIDGAEVAELAETCSSLGRWEFLFTLGAMPVIGATGIPVNPLAIF